MDTPTLTERAGQHIRDLRKSRHCTLAHVALATGLSVSYLSEIERGVQAITLARLEQLATAFEVDPLRLLGVDADERARRLACEDRLRAIALIAG